MIGAGEVRPLYRMVSVLGVVAVAILALGLVELLVLEPVSEHTGARVAVTGVYAYDPSAERLSGSPATRFPAGQPFAALIDWPTAPPSAVVGAHWSNALGSVVGEVTPRPATQMGERERVLPVKVPPDLHRNLPGEYVLVVERYRDGRPVEVLAHRRVLVTREP